MEAKAARILERLGYKPEDINDPTLVERMIRFTYDLAHEDGREEGYKQGKEAATQIAIEVLAKASSKLLNPNA